MSPEVQEIVRQLFAGMVGLVVATAGSSLIYGRKIEGLRVAIDGLKERDKEDRDTKRRIFERLDSIVERVAKLEGKAP